jgi:hypothetical protein
MSPEFRLAVVRGIVQAGSIALLTALIHLPQVEALGWKLYTSIVFVPAVMFFGTRVFGEGWYDTARAQVPGTPQAAAREVRQAG